MARYIWLLAPLVGLLVLAGPAAAQEQQWLSYRSDGQPEMVTGQTQGASLKIADLPADLNLPAGLGGNRVAAKWTTPAVKAGFLWVVVACSRTPGPIDQLVIDSSADGRLDDEQPIQAADARVAGEFQSVEFPRVKVLLPGADGPAAYHMNISVNSARGTCQITAHAAGWYEGTVRVDGKKFPCSLFDANANGVFNDGGEDFAYSDRLRIDAGGSFAIARVGRFVQVVGKFYNLAVAPDGSWLKLAQPAALEFGVVRVGGVD